MTKRIQTMIVSVSIFGLAVLFGCASVMDAITPCYISPACLEYAESEPTTFVPYTSLGDAERVRKKMYFVYLTRQVEYNFLKGLSAFHIGAAQEFQAAVFSPSGAIGLLFPAAFGTGIGALLIKRPGDKSKKEIETEANNNQVPKETK